LQGQCGTWEKTEHVLAKTSRLNADMTRPLLELERYLSDLERSEELSAQTALQVFL
jgi:hypothetical protein